MTDTRTFRVVDEDGDYYEITGDPTNALNAAYRERAHLVALLAAIYPATWTSDPEGTDWHIVYVDLPTGQVSWHIAPADVDLFPHVSGGGQLAADVWDGHDTDEKYFRVDQLAVWLGELGGVETVGGHLGAQVPQLGGKQPQDERDALAARVAELERELLALRGTELNPSPTILDAQSYGEVRDAIAATMTDDWDGEDSEPYILIQYVRWLAAGQPRDEDGYPIRRETYLPAEQKAAQDERGGDVRAVAALLDVLARTDQRNRPKMLHEPIAEVRGRFANRIAELDAREAKGGE